MSVQRHLGRPVDRLGLCGESMTIPKDYKSHSSHWGAFHAKHDGGQLQIIPHPNDPDPSPILDNFLDSLRHEARITQPMVRQGWLNNAPNNRRDRGSDSYIPVSWETAVNLVAQELERVRSEFGIEALYAGSYGWSSAGRFHHAQSQVHRFFNTALGGYVRHINNYSSGASDVLFPHIVGDYDGERSGPLLEQIASETELLVSFGGLPLRNTAVHAGGISQHVAKAAFEQARARGCRFSLISPQLDDMATVLEAEWFPLRPLTDTALILALAWTLVAEALHDVAFLEQYTTGFPVFLEYLLGHSDGVAKTPEWAAAICEISPENIRSLARLMARSRTLISLSYSLQRAEFGEQPLWAAVTLASMLGQIGVPGGGFVYSLSSLGNVGKQRVGVRLPTLPQGKNGTDTFIPVARIADLLMNPGKTYQYNGKVLTYPDIKLVYWAGGNPFHHHQDLSRLAEAFSRPQTIIVHDPFWTATAKHADIVLPATLTLERDDLGASRSDPLLIAMKRILPPSFQARDDFEIFADIAEKLGRREAFTEGRNQRQWLEHLYNNTREDLAGLGHEDVDFDKFWERGELSLPLNSEPEIFAAFRADPRANALSTPSGRIEIFSGTIAGFGYDDCPGHPVWLEPDEWLGGPLAAKHPLQLVANQPAGKLHSQLDFARNSQSYKIDGREVLKMHPEDAADRDLVDGDVARVYNDRGACLVVIKLSASIRPQVVQMSTGSWYHPFMTDEGTIACMRGNPNTVTRDAGTSRLAQATTGQLCLVEVEKCRRAPASPPYRPPAVESQQGNTRASSIRRTHTSLD